jgi:glycerol-3-phosphate dehydrogenase (NAD(P)+)
MTLESLVVIRRLADAITIRARKGQVSLEDFPLLHFVISVLDSGKMEELPWKQFTFENL